MERLISVEENKQKEYERLRQEILCCRSCRDEFGFEPRPVFQGNIGSRIMQIGQAPSRNVHQTGRPFDDASGRKLREEWYQISDSEFYNPDNFYIVSVARCFPGKAPGGGDRRPPKRCAQKWLFREMELVDNALYILIGKYAADFFFPKKEFTSLVFGDQQLRGKPAFVLPHPSPLNVKWFLDHPEFDRRRVREIASAVHEILGIALPQDARHGKLG